MQDEILADCPGEAYLFAVCCAHRFWAPYFFACSRLHRNTRFEMWCSQDDMGEHDLDVDCKGDFNISALKQDHLQTRGKSLQLHRDLGRLGHFWSRSRSWKNKSLNKIWEIYWAHFAHLKKMSRNLKIAIPGYRSNNSFRWHEPTWLTRFFFRGWRDGERGLRRG